MAPAGAVEGKMADTYQLPDVTGTLDFSEGPWRGARVVARLTAPLATYFDILEAVEASDVHQLRTGLELWATEVLVEWNVHDRQGTPLPPDAGGFFQLPLQWCVELVQTWLAKVPEVELPSDGGSPGTATSGTRRAPSRRRPS